MRKNVSGFTIVELLIVVVVIAILAAISIVAFNGVQNRANDTAIQADLNNFSKKVAEFHVLNERYPLDTTELTSLGIKTSKNAYDTNRILNFSYCRNTGGVAYAIGGISKSGKRFFVSSQSNVAEYSGSISNDGNESVANGSCSDFVSGAVRISGGFYSADPYNNGWRAWTGS